MEFSHVLKELRTSRGMTQEDLANAIQTKRANVGNWESGRVSPDFSTVKKLADFFGVTTDYLFGNNYTVTKEYPVLVYCQEDIDFMADLKSLPPEGQAMMKRTLEDLKKIYAAQKELSAVKEEPAS